MALLFLVRHGQASFGSADYDRLSDLGRAQSRWLGEYFRARNIRFKRAVSGTLKRQRDTATELLAAMGGDATVLEHAGLNEYHGEALYRAHTGGRNPVEHQRADYNDYWRTFRAATQAWAEDRLSGVPETWDQFGARSLAGIRLACEGLSREDSALAVSSGGAISRAVAALIGSPGAVAVEFNLQFRNSGFVEFIVSGSGDAQRLRMVAFNAIPHIDTPERRHAITFA